MVETYFDFSIVRENVFDIPIYVCVGRTKSNIYKELSRQNKRQKEIHVPACEETWRRVTTPWTRSEDRWPDTSGSYFLAVKTDGGINGLGIRCANYTPDGEFVDRHRLAPFIFMYDTIKKEDIVAWTPIPEGAIEE